MEFEHVKSMDALRKLYGMPMDLVVKKQKSALDQYSAQFLSLSAFCALSTSSANGNMDCSPRGDYPGFIKALDEQTLLIPDRPGNNRLDSLSNIIENPNVGLLVLIPGFKECLRINGTANIVTNSEILTRLEYQGKKPKAAIVLSITEIYFHCAKAITRSKLWEQESHVQRDVMPSLGRILMAQTDPSKSDEDIKAVEALIEERVKTTLY
jgi:PPOX class probable FMN-dependent enzyme